LVRDVLILCARQLLLRAAHERLQPAFAEVGSHCVSADGQWVADEAKKFLLNLALVADLVVFGILDDVVKWRGRVGWRGGW